MATRSNEKTCGIEHATLEFEDELATTGAERCEDVDEKKDLGSRFGAHEGVSSQVSVIGQHAGSTGLADAYSDIDVGAIACARITISHVCGDFANCTQCLEYDFDHTMCIDGVI